MLKSIGWKIRGIVNGIDLEEWSPEKDKFLDGDGYERYAPDESGLAGKAACKAALQKELGLEVNPKIPLIGKQVFHMFSRICSDRCDD